MEFDELAQLLVTLDGNSVAKFGSCFEDKVSGVNIEMVSSFGVVSNAETNNLGHLFACVGFETLFDEERAKLWEGLVVLGFGFSFMDVGIKDTGALHDSFDEHKVPLRI